MGTETGFNVDGGEYVNCYGCGCQIVFDRPDLLESYGWRNPYGQWLCGQCATAFTTMPVADQLTLKEMSGLRNDICKVVILQDGITLSRRLVTMFRILESIELQGWREQAIDMPLERWRYCPCDGTELRTVAAVMGGERREVSYNDFEWDEEWRGIRVGCCPACGYMGYIDRPSAEWFQQFYASEWDQYPAEAVQNTINGIRAEGLKADTHPIAGLAGKIPFSPDARVFEMGTGYGWALACMKQYGYKNLSGVESCPHRARVAREGFGFDVRHEAIEDHQGGPYDVILSHHVLEHCYDPAAVARKLASLQPEGGYLVLAVPNNAGEPTMGVLMFLPHLHSFTKKGLAWLLDEAGYTVLEDCSDHEGQWLIARKTATTEQKFYKVRHWQDCFWAGEYKLRKGLTAAMDASYFCWKKPKDHCWRLNEIVPGTGSEIGKDTRCLRVEPIRERRTDAPIEIQWEGPLRLFVK